MTDSTYTHLALVVDRSGSMVAIAEDMNGGITTLLADQAKQDGKCLVDVWTFDDITEHVVTDAQPGEVAGDLVHPRGWTALNDAVGRAVTELGERFAAMDEADRPAKVVIVVVTDGHENASKDWTAQAVKDLVTRQQDEWGWTFLYLAANVDAFATGGALGFGQGQSLNYAPSAGGVGVAYAAVSANVTSLRNGAKNAEFTDADREAANR